VVTVVYDSVVVELVLELYFVVVSYIAVVDSSVVVSELELVTSVVGVVSYVVVVVDSADVDSADVDSVSIVDGDDDVDSVGEKVTKTIIDEESSGIAFFSVAY